MLDPHNRRTAVSSSYRNSDCAGDALEDDVRRLVRLRLAPVEMRAGWHVPCFARGAMHHTADRDQSSSIERALRSQPGGTHMARQSISRRNFMQQSAAWAAAFAAGSSAAIGPAHAARET